MKQNENIAVLGKCIVLVPYERKHVEKYHEWMKSEELQQLTASEPLSMEEEYNMQQRWRDDTNKCTFIVLDKRMFTATQGKETEAMVGDVNLFFNDPDSPQSAEIEIMVAEPSARGKGMGKEALFSMIRYGIEDLKVSRYTAKIGMENSPSLKMFQKIGFKEISRSEVFREVTLEWKVTESAREQVMTDTVSYQIVSYPLSNEVFSKGP